MLWKCCTHLKFMSIELVMLSNHRILYCPILLLLSIFASILVFSKESTLCLRRQKYWSFSFNNRAYNEYSGLISFRIDWFDLLSVQGTLKNLFQHHSSKASILRHSAFFMIQWILAIGSLVPLPFLNPAWTSGSSWFTYCLSLAWRILSITVLACEMSAIVQ